MTTKIDLHTHSTHSDGTDSPSGLVTNAAKAGLDVVALTDHDTTGGWTEAQVAADHHGIRLIRGIELSTRNQGHGQHLLAYRFDPAHPELVEMLQRGVEARHGRIPAMLAKLRELGIDLDEDVVRRAAGDGTIGRPHIAAAMIAAGHVADQTAAFDQYLKPGQPAYVERYAPTIEEAIAVIGDAGGVTVIAHPRGRRGFVSDARLAELAELGLAGIEVSHQEHDDETRAGLRRIASELGLVITGSSDYHGENKKNHDLGCNLTDPEQLERLLASVG